MLEERLNSAGADYNYRPDHQQMVKKLIRKNREENVEVEFVPLDVTDLVSLSTTNLGATRDEACRSRIALIALPEANGDWRLDSIKIEVRARLRRRLTKVSEELNTDTRNTGRHCP